MNRHLSSLSRLVLPALLGLGASALVSAAPLGTGFTYQGRLNDNGQPASGTYDLVFSIYATASADVPLAGGGVWNDNVTVADGVFTTIVDFGTDAFTGEELWLEIGVRPGDATGDFTLLTPRQRLTASPYAHFARRAATAASADTAKTADVAKSVQEVPWSAVKDLPPAFADGTDNDTTYTAGPGLKLNAENQLSVEFFGSGLGNGAARYDHDHLGHSWTGEPGGSGLLVHHTAANGVGLHGRNAAGTGFTPASGTGVLGDSDEDPGVTGFSRTGSGVYGRTFAATGSNDAVKGENASATGRGVAGYATATTGANIGVLGQTDSNGGTGIRGYATATTGTTYGGRFSNVSPDGYAIHGLSDQSGVAYFDINNPANSSPAVEARTDGKGFAGSFIAGNATTTVAALNAVNLGNGNGIFASAGGAGNGGEFRAITAGADNAAVKARGLGAARGISAVSTSGEALRAESSGTAILASTDTGTAIHAKSDQDGTALAIEGGSIQVKGAGVNTKTAVFVHQCTSGNTPPSATGNTITFIDHPMCNGNPNAVLLVTPRGRLVTVQGVEIVSGTYDHFAIAYFATKSKWGLINTSLLDESGDFDEGDRFNVMIVLP